MKWQTTRVSLIRRLRDPGDGDAWLRFERSYGEVILRYACRRGLGLADAEDVRQTVLVSMLRAMQRFELRPERGRFRSYLGRVVGNAIQKYQTRPHRLYELPQSDLEPCAPPYHARELDTLWEQEWTDHHLRRALATVRSAVEPRSLEIFERLLNGDTVEQVAEALGAKVEAVRKVRQRVRLRLQAEVRRQLDDETRASWRGA